jgi:hypothetical protein
MRIRWTPSNIARLRELAEEGLTMREAADKFGAAKCSIGTVAYKLKIHFHGRRNRPVMSDEEACRARWIARLPAMKAALVRDILHDTA